MKYKHELIQPIGALPVWMKIFHNSPADNIAPHWHQSIELSYTQKGQIDNFFINNHNYNPHGGDILVINSHEIHSITTKKHSDESLALSIIYPYSQIQRFFPDFDQYVIKINNPSSFNDSQRHFYKRLQSILDQIIYFSLNDNRQSLKMTILLLQALDILISYFTVIKKNSAQNNQKTFVIERLQIITTFIQKHFREDLSLDKIADVAHISKEYLARFFKENMGITVGQYVKNIRAQQVYKYLSDQRFTLTKIANQNGFSGLHSMNRALTEIYGKNAREIRKLLRNQNK